MRYRAIIAVDLFAKDKKDAQKQLDKVIGDLPCSFELSLEFYPHGSDISLIDKEPVVSENG
mgnify:FL=1